MMLDMFEQGDVVLAIWLASQYPEAIELARCVCSLVGEPIFSPLWALRYSRRGLFVSPYHRAEVVKTSRQNQLAMQAAVDAATAAGGGVIHIPAGYFELSSEINCDGTSNIMFMGAPEKVTTLARPPDVLFRRRRRNPCLDIDVSGVAGATDTHDD